MKTRGKNYSIGRAEKFQINIKWLYGKANKLIK